MHNFKIIAVLFLATLISACSMFSQKDKPAVYQSNVKKTHPLVMPADLSKEDQEDDYPLPKLETPPANTNVTILPPGSNLVKDNKK